MTCPSCGQESPEGFRFCGACGTALDAAHAAEVRKVVTIVFCDLVGSTALGERSDPEVLREVMSRYHSELRTILELHGGTVEKFVGDAAMAVFGLPQAHEDDALRAVRAAVQMRDAVATLGLDVRTGVNTGEVVAGAGETLVTGDAVNVAARLEQAAHSGQVLIGSETERLVRDQVLVEPVEPLTLKGKSEPVPAFSVEGLQEEVPAFTRPITSPFVGRADELALLEQALTAAFESRTPQLATIVGPPGIGKSRLARELLTRCESRTLIGRCVSYGEGITYLPLAEIASQVGDIKNALDGEGDGELVSARVEAAITTSGTAATPEEIAWGVRRLVETLAGREPLVVVFDDIHWAEPALLDLIEYVATFAQGVPLFVLCMARPDLFDVRPTWAAPKPNATLLSLDPLSGPDSETLVGLLGRIPAEAHARIVEAADGNPLFVEQLVAMQSESGDGELEVPPTLQALLAARIDRLADAERAVVERGSVEGRLFHRGAVAALLPEPEQRDVGGHLLTLVRKELIRPDRAILSGDDGFRFGHILIRDAAYEAIPKRLRATLHEGYADWLVSKLGDNAPDETVGYHLEQAYRYGVELGTPDPVLGERAAERLAAAGRAARARRDAGATVNLLGRAVELLLEGPMRSDLLLALGDARKLAGDMTGAQAAFDEAASAAAGDEHLEWVARIGLASMRLENEGTETATQDALEEAEAAIAAREPAADHDVLALAWDLISDVHGLRGMEKDSRRALDLALKHARLTGDLILELPIVMRSAGPLVFGPAPVEEGLRFVDEVLGRFGDAPEIQAFALHVQAHMRARLGEFEGAFEAVTAWRRHKLELGQQAMYAQTAGCAWDVCLWAEDWVRGEEVLREGYEMVERLGMKTFLPTQAAHLGEAVYRLGRLDEAERLSETSEELGASDDAYNEMSWRRLRAKVLACRGDLAGAQALARRAVEMGRELGFLEEAALAWLDLAEILGASGDPGARAATMEARDRFERKGNLVGLARANALLGDLP
jgi:class 3 adenylate cyclase/tetratricopeptide (TPR) repeat protein